MVRALFARTVHDSLGDSMIGEYVSDDTNLRAIHNLRKSSIFIKIVVYHDVKINLV